MRHDRIDHLWVQVLPPSHDEAIGELADEQLTPSVMQLLSRLIGE